MHGVESKGKSQPGKRMSDLDWRLNIDGFQTAENNMAEDSAMLARCEQGLLPPTLRVYGWSEPSISLGYSQNAEAELDLERCRELAIPVVRRPTGGRALLHYNELTYAVVAPVTLAPFNRGLKATFQAISEALLLGLKGLGVQGDINTRNQKFKPVQSPVFHQSLKGLGIYGDIKTSKQRSGPVRSPACYASLNHCEITVDGKKLVGSAQKRTSKAFLQHGSLVIESDHELFASLLKFDDERQRINTRQRLLDATTGLNRVCGRELIFEEICNALWGGFQKTFGGPWDDGCTGYMEYHPRAKTKSRLVNQYHRQYKGG